MYMRCFVLMLALAASAAAWAAPLTFDFKAPKGLNSVTFKFLGGEAVAGEISGTAGDVKFDPADPASVKGRLLISVNSLESPHAAFLAHARSDKGLDPARHPVIAFQIDRAAGPRTIGDDTTADVVGTLTVRGTARPVTVPAKLTYLKDKLRTRGPQVDGDLLLVRATIKLKRADFGLAAGPLEGKLADEVEVTVNLTGQCPR